MPIVYLFLYYFSFLSLPLLRYYILINFSFAYICIVWGERARFHYSDLLLVICMTCVPLLVVPTLLPYRVREAAKKVIFESWFWLSWRVARFLPEASTRSNIQNKTEASTRSNRVSRQRRLPSIFSYLSQVEHVSFVFSFKSVLSKRRLPALVLIPISIELFFLLLQYAFLARKFKPL